MPYILTRRKESTLDLLMITILLVMGLALIGLGIYQWRSSQKSAPVANDVSATTSNQAVNEVSNEVINEKPANEFLQSRLHWEEDRLARLQMDYDNVNAQLISSASINNQITTITENVRALQEQIAQNQIQLGSIVDDESDFQTQNSIDRNNTRIALENQIVQIQADQTQLQNQAVPAATPSPSANATTDRSNPNSPPVYDSAGNLINTGPAAFAPPPAPVNSIQNQVANLELQKTQVDSAIKVNDLEAENRSLQARRDVQSTRNALLTAREDLQRQLKDSKDELTYWQARKKEMGNENLRQQRLQALQVQINEQLGRIAKVREGL